MLLRIPIGRQQDGAWASSYTALVVGWLPKAQANKTVLRIKKAAAAPALLAGELATLALALQAVSLQAAIIMTPGAVPPPLVVDWRPKAQVNKTAAMSSKVRAASLVAPAKSALT